MFGASIWSSWSVSTVDDENPTAVSLPTFCSLITSQRKTLARFKLVITGLVTNVAFCSSTSIACEVVVVPMPRTASRIKLNEWENADNAL